MTDALRAPVALRYLLAKRRQAFISVISLISTLGVTVGVMALVIALALMTGLQQELRDRILGSIRARLRLEDRRHHRLPRRGREAASVPGVIGAAPAILGKALISTGTSRGVHHAQGHRPGARAEVTDIAAADAERLA